MIFVLDNYDSFTYNLVHLMGSLGAEMVVERNRETSVAAIMAMRPDGILLSPGPSRPENAGCMLDLIHAAAGRIPMLGVCLGHQAIGEVFGARLENLSEVYHGVATPCHIIADDSIFEGVERDITIGRYHSWVVSDDNFPSCLEITAVSDDMTTDGASGAHTRQVMALRHRQYDVHGIQFHPESVLTPCGRQIIKNFIAL